MSVTVFLSNTNIQIVVGSGSAAGANVKKLVSVSIPNGAVLNGVVMDDGALVTAIKECWRINKLPKGDVTLILNSPQLRANFIDIPIMPASGIDIVAPSSHKRLAAKILETGGLILSEYLPGTPPAQFRYIQRNRIVAALSPVTLVVQAPAGSGAMITADLALGYNREVIFHSECFSREVPAKEGKEKSSSPKSFVEDGAKVISGYCDFKNLMYT